MSRARDLQEHAGHTYEDQMHSEDHDDYAELDEDMLTCMRCGTRELHWQAIIKADGTPGYALFNERNRKHVCGQPDINDFPVMK